MNRYELDALATHYRLQSADIDALLDAAHARPSRPEHQRFIFRLLQLAGVLSLAAGIVFFIAANWDALAVFGRFALIETLLLATVALALYAPPPATPGKYALLMAFILVGVLLALFGQTYQTGADTYELFLSWALFGALFVSAARWSIVWGAWLLVLNVAFGLYCGWRPESGLLWAVFGGWATALWLPLAAMSVDLLAFALVQVAQRTAYAYVTPPWLGHFALACASTFATWSGCLAILEDDASLSARVLVLVVIVAVYGVLIVHSIRKRADIFPMALIAGSTILLLTVALGDALSFADAGSFFLIALWLIASSTLAGRLLMRLMRAWRLEADSQ